MNPLQGRFLTVEGAEGVGKSSNIEFIAGYLRDRGKTVLTTREPGGTPVAERIRDVLLNSEKGSVSDECELLLMFAARASHLDELIRPALGRGEWVVCDRFTDASYAYQGGGRGLPEATIAGLEEMVQKPLAPDLTLLLDADPAVTAPRRKNRGQHDRFEAEENAFFDRVRERYLEIGTRDPDRVKLVDASADLATVQQRVAKVLEAFISKADNK
jgi:dTMP kinase